MGPRYNWFFKLLVFIGRQSVYRYLSVTSTGLEKLPPQHRFILASNHRSTLDPVLVLLYLLPKLGCMISPAATRGLFVGPLGWLLRKMGAIQIDRTTRRNLKNIRRILLTLKTRPILIYPEGGIVTPPEKRTGLTGVAFMAERSGVPVVPVAMVGTQHALPKGGRWIRRRKVQIRIGPCLHFGEFDQAESHRAFTNRLMAAIEALEGGSDQG